MISNTDLKEDCSTYESSALGEEELPIFEAADRLKYATAAYCTALIDRKATTSKPKPVQTVLEVRYLCRQLPRRNQDGHDFLCA